jgi:diguanylate cyclase (GGDEF)-like protein/PAS domain S-box-containing protein
MAMYSPLSANELPQDRLNRLLNATSNLIQNTSKAIPAKGLLNQAIHALSSLTEAKYGAIAIFKNSKTKYFVTYGANKHYKSILKDFSEIKDLLSLTRETKHPLCINDIKESPFFVDFPEHHSEITSLLAIPIIKQDDVFGCIYLYDTYSGKPFSNTDQALVRSFASSLGLIIENTEHQQEKNIAEAQAKLHAEVFRNSTEAVLITDKKGYILSVNQAFLRITGHDSSEIIGKTPMLLKSSMHNNDFYNKLWSELQQYGYWHGELFDKRKNGEVFPARLSISAINNNNETTHYVGMISDMSEQKQFQDKIRHLAYYDALTDLPNRVLFQDRIQQLASNAQRNNKPFAIILIDLDHFKNINDSLGHEVGDEILRQLAAQLFRNIRIGDTVARLGDDEFGVTLSQLTHPEDAAIAADKIIHLLKQPFLLDGHKIPVTASLGISIFPNDGDEAGLLIRNAEAAMNHAKTKHRNNYQFYSDEITNNTNKRLKLVAELNHALENNEFILHYQPKIDLNTGQLTSVEALLRWQHPVKGIIPPNEFIPALEESGLIIPVGDWVIKAACQQAMQWLAEDIESPRIAVNVSAKQFDKEHLINSIKSAIATYPGCADYLEIEITETTLMHDPIAAALILGKLKDMGIHLSVDDFGTGYSSLSYLSRFPIDTLKIDQSFIQQATTDSNNASITHSVIDLAHNLGIKALGEGVETQEQLDFLISLGCDFGQGYLFSRPVHANQYPELLDDEKTFNIQKQNTLFNNI